MRPCRVAWALVLPGIAVAVGRATQDPDSYELENWTRGADALDGRHVIPSGRVRMEV